MASDDAALRRLALAQLKEITPAPVAFDPDGSPESRAAQLDELRRTLITAPTTVPALLSDKPKP
jgi:hypothetical protein